MMTTTNNILIYRIDLMKIKQRYVRYFILLLSFVIFTYAIKVFVQNFNMNKEINTLKIKQSNLSWDTVWMAKYYKPYVNSDYAKKSFLHKLWMPSKNEILIKIGVKKTIVTWFVQSIDNYKKYNYTNDVQGKWNSFFSALSKNIF